VIELQADGACYSWRLPPPRWLGGMVSVEARKKLVRCSREELCEGHCPVTPLVLSTTKTCHVIMIAC
jgi:hypothetical protein